MAKELGFNNGNSKNTKLIKKKKKFNYGKWFNS